jgi:hypothetical protein
MFVDGTDALIRPNADQCVRRHPRRAPTASGIGALVVPPVHDSVFAEQNPFAIRKAARFAGCSVSVRAQRTIQQLSMRFDFTGFDQRRRPYRKDVRVRGRCERARVQRHVPCWMPWITRSAAMRQSHCGRDLLQVPARSANNRRC